MKNLFSDEDEIKNGDIREAHRLLASEADPGDETEEEDEEEEDEEDEEEEDGDDQDDDE